MFNPVFPCICTAVDFGLIITSSNVSMVRASCEWQTYIGDRGLFYAENCFQPDTKLQYHVRCLKMT